MCRRPETKAAELGFSWFDMIGNCLLLLYPLLVHAAIVLDSRWLELAALLLLATNVLSAWLVRIRWWAWIAEGLAIVASVIFVMQGEGRLFLYAASVISPLALMWLFGHTLFPGQTPLVTRIADDMMAGLPDAVRVYTRRVTQMWVMALGGFALANGLLALFASPIVWSLFSNFINYLVVGSLFVAEWLFRRWYMRNYESMTWREYVRALTQINFRRLLA